MKYCVTAAAAAYFQHVELYAQNACIVVNALLRCGGVTFSEFAATMKRAQFPTFTLPLSLHVENVDEYFS